MCRLRAAGGRSNRARGHRRGEVDRPRVQGPRQYSPRVRKQVRWRCAARSRKSVGMRRFGLALGLVAFAGEARAELPAHPAVTGADIGTVEVDGPAGAPKPKVPDAGAPKPWET